MSGFGLDERVPSDHDQSTPAMSGARPRWTTRSGIRVRYLDNAPEQPLGLPVLFSPGLTDFADDYIPMLEYLAPRRVLVVEVRGRGSSEAPPSGYAVADHARDLEAVVAEEGLERFHLMTFSRGTSWALELAFADPSRVASLSIGDYLAIEMELGPEFTDDQMLSRWRGLPVSERVQRHVMAGLQAQSKGRDLWDAVGRLPIPLLLARGADGGIVDDAAVARYRAIRPDVEIVVIPGATHDVFRPDRTAYPAAVAEWIARQSLDG
jgi:non-heme chloroperoxidase